jgi:cyclopropane-fatty-acyl-phospholipid synthase
MAFRIGELMNFQLQLSKDQAALPLTRDYMLEAEARLLAADMNATDRRPLRLAGE